MDVSSKLTAILILITFINIMRNFDLNDWNSNFYWLQRNIRNRHSWDHNTSPGLLDRCSDMLDESARVGGDPEIRKQRTLIKRWKTKIFNERFNSSRNR
jgi:hypothetical protein